MREFQLEVNKEAKTRSIGAKEIVIALCLIIFLPVAGCVSSTIVVRMTPRSFQSFAVVSLVDSDGNSRELKREEKVFLESDDYFAQAAEEVDLANWWDVSEDEAPEYARESARIFVSQQGKRALIFEVTAPNPFDAAELADRLAVQYLLVFGPAEIREKQELFEKREEEARVWERGLEDGSSITNSEDIYFKDSMYSAMRESRKTFELSVRDSPFLTRAVPPRRSAGDFVQRTLAIGMCGGVLSGFLLAGLYLWRKSIRRGVDGGE